MRLTINHVSLFIEYQIQHLVIPRPSRLRQIKRVLPRRVGRVLNTTADTRHIAQTVEAALVPLFLRINGVVQVTARLVDLHL